MADDEAFIRAIRAHPDDDLPRLVYADFLDERGDSARAEFVRVQIELARLRPGDRGPRKALEARERALLAAHHERWEASVRADAEEWRFDRGFIGQITTSAARFIAHSEALLREHPITGVHFAESWEDIVRLAQCPGFGELRHAHFVHNQLGADEVMTLVQSPHLTQLEGLDLTENRLDGVAIGAIAAAPALARLRQLNLSRNDVTLEGLAALANAKHLNRLSVLRLADAKIRLRGVLALGSREGLPGLAELDLSDNPLGTAGARALVASKQFLRLRRLDLRRSYIPTGWCETLRSHFGEAVLL
jgi:uncharacterized protein (TIGR02996 family)